MSTEQQHIVGDSPGEVIEKAFNIVYKHPLPVKVQDAWDLVSHLPSPLKTIQKKQAISNLSEEAHQALYLLLSHPASDFEYQGKISKQRIYAFLRKRKSWTLAFVLQIMKELSSLNGNLMDL